MTWRVVVDGFVDRGPADAVAEFLRHGSEVAGITVTVESDADPIGRHRLAASEQIPTPSDTPV